jgi:glyoxylase-like metal-dependent hydrolase (beta-lactamase superfamily II)
MLEDNFCYLVTKHQSLEQDKQAYSSNVESKDNSKRSGYMVVDVSEPEKLQKFFEVQGEQGLISGIQKVLTTHKHWDHSNGNSVMHDLVKNLDVVGGKYDNVQGATTHVEDGQ